LEQLIGRGDRGEFEEALAHTIGAGAPPEEDLIADLEPPNRANAAGHPWTFSAAASE